MRFFNLLQALGVCASVLATTNSLSAGFPASVVSSPAAVASVCCQAIKAVLGSKVSFPNTTSYEAATDSYWSFQAIVVSPTCIISPIDAEDVSLAVATLNALSLLGAPKGIGCEFAIKSGGHTPWAGAATIQNGVTIDLGALDDVVVSADQKTTSIGPGNRWADIYLKLDALGLAIPGGRSGAVGVGGLVTGGGISFFSPRYGFVCDSVQNFEVVLGSGAIVSANATSNPTLWAPLKGGSNNFGVVTRFDMKTFAQGDMWGGEIVYPITTLDAQLEAFVAYANQPEYDIYGALINSYAWSAATGFVVDNEYTYSEPTAYPASFANFTAIGPEYLNTMRITNLTDIAIELEGASSEGTNEIFFTSTYSVDLDTLTHAYNQWNTSLQSIIGVDGLVWSLTFQPLPTAITKYGPLTGGNSLGLDASAGNLALVLLTAGFTNASDLPTVTAAATELFARNDAYAASVRTLHSYQYLNYAYKTQKPIEGYGAAEVAKLKAASLKYDPTQVFQKLVPGGFKLPL